MSKRELIDRIRVLNPTAPTSFLAKFPEADLTEYLEHLTESSSVHPRSRNALPDPQSMAARESRQLAMAF